MSRKKKNYEGLDLTPPKPRSRVKKIFTQEQLFEAYRQMIDEREQEIEEAEKVAAYLAEKVGLSFGIVESRELPAVSEIDEENEILLSMRVAAISGSGIVYPVKYGLQFTYCQYDVIPTEKFAELGITAINPKHHDEKIGELDISEIPDFKDHMQKKYPILASYYDAHGWGY